MSFTFSAGVVAAAIYLAGIVEFTVWCDQAPVAAEVASSDE